MPPKPPPIEIRLPKFNPRAFQVIIILLLLVWGLWSAVYTVPAESVGIVQRFGKALPDPVPPGLHVKMPFGVDTVTPVPMLRQLKAEFGFQSDSFTNPDQVGGDPHLQRSMVTGDLNAALVDWVVQYRIDDPHRYLFDVNNPGRTLRDLSEAVMREIIGDRTVDEVITVGRQDIESKAKDKLSELVKVYNLGMVIDQVQLKDVDPPEPVQDSFDEVNKAQQDRENLTNLANGEYNKVVPRAKGEADQKIQGAEGYRLKRINEAKGDVASFNAQFAEYLKAPEVTRTRLYLEAMKEVIPQAGAKVIVDDSVKQVFPLIPGSAPTALPAMNQNTAPRR